MLMLLSNVKDRALAVPWNQMQSKNVLKSMATANNSPHEEMYQQDPSWLMARGPWGAQAVSSLPSRASKQPGLN